MICFVTERHKSNVAQKQRKDDVATTNVFDAVAKDIAYLASDS